MKWLKKGLIYKPSGELWWNKTHAYIPTVDVLEDSYRIYFAGYDENKRGRIGYIEVEKENPKNILYLTEEPVLDIGKPGMFDCDGVSPTCIYTSGDNKYLYYFGWQRTEAIPFMLFAGLAKSEDGGKIFKKVSNIPLLERTSSGYYRRSAPFTIHDKLYYVSGGNTYSIYINRKQCIDLKEDELGIGRPYVIYEDNMYKMWYSYRGKNPYKVGYAESKDGYIWNRLDNVEFVGEVYDWDCGMKCMPCVVDDYMFYNGNGIGETGFGYAKLLR